MTARIAPEVEQHILDLWAVEKNGSLVSEAVGLSPTTVYRVLTRNGVAIDRADVRRRRSRTTPETDAEIVERYKAGEGAGALATEYGFACHLSVLKRVREAGVEVRKPGPAFAEIPPSVGERIIELRQQGWAQERIAAAVGIGQARVSRWLQANGLRAWKPERHPNYKGGRAKASGGYIVVKLSPDDPYFCMADKANGYVKEHRLVMARALGRPLEKHETVHHINGDPADNDIENLQLRQGAHGKGVRITCLDCGSHNVGAVPL